MSLKNMNSFQQVDLALVVGFLIKQWKIYILSAVFFLFIFSIISLNLTKIWTADAVVIESNSKSSSADPATASMVASFAGINLGGGGSDVLMTIKRQLRTKDFFAEMIQDEEFYKDIIAVSGYDEENKTNLYDSEFYDSDKSKWISKPSFLKAYEKYLTIVKSGFLDETYREFLIIRADHRSPISAKNIVDKIVVRINENRKADDIEEADNMINYLELELLKTNQVSIIQAINRLMENQIKSKMFANVKDDYVIKVLDSPYIPEKRSKPRRTIFVLAGTFIAELLLTLFFITKLLFFRPSKEIV